MVLPQGPAILGGGGGAVNQAEPACPAYAHTDTQQVTQSRKTAIPCGTASPRADLLAPWLEKARPGQNLSSLWLAPPAMVWGKCIPPGPARYKNLYNLLKPTWP